MVQPADPCGSIPGGIDTFIRGEINNAPEDIDYSVVGITTDSVRRPVGKWTRCELHNSSFQFFPVASHDPNRNRPLIPATVRYLLRLGSVASEIDADILEFHRVEPILRFLSDTRPKTAVMHQNMKSLYEKQADIRWAILPGLYFWFEDRLVPKLQSAFCVREDVVDHLQNRFTNLADSCWFQPTWADPQQFFPPTVVQRQEYRAKLAADLHLDTNSLWLISVGRLDAQKNPMLLIDSIRRLIEQGNDKICVLIVGEGPLRDEMNNAVRKAQLSDKVRFLGLKRIEEIARLLHAVDLYVMSSAYEGMPMAVIEALASGVPVATTRVGEVGRVVLDGICGRIAESHSEESLSEAIAWCLGNLHEISGAPCTASAGNYSPTVVLEAKYEHYRRLAAANAAGNDG